MIHAAIHNPPNSLNIANMTHFAERRDKLRKLVHKANAEALLVAGERNVTYLTGFTGDSSQLLLLPRGEILLTDSRYTTQLRDECPDLELVVRRAGTSMIDVIEQTVAKAKLRKLAVEADVVTLAAAKKLREKLVKVELVETSGLVEQLRIIKDRAEIDEIRLAVRQAERVFELLRASLRPDQTELEIANELEFNVRRFGSRDVAFPPIVAAGATAALPHYQPSDRRIGGADLLLVDWGVRHRLYRSDLTRTLITGKLSSKLARVYDTVLSAQQRAIAAIRPGAVLEDVDAVARKVIADAGFDKYFGHGLGHGIGLDIHEAPRMAPNEKDKLRPGMIVTVEPGIYLPDVGGVRIEDDVLVTRDGAEVLSTLPKSAEAMTLA